MQFNSSNSSSIPVRQTKEKVNKNDKLRRSKSAQKWENSATQSELPRETGNEQIQSLLSSPGLHGDADSAIGSDTTSVNCMSFEEEKLPYDVSNLDLKPKNEILPEQSPHSLQSVPGNAYHQDCPVSNIGEKSDIGIDGPQSDIVLPEIDETMSDIIQPSISTSLALPQSQGGMSDFIILHTDADMNAAHVFSDHLQRDIGIPDLTVDLLSNIDAGKSQFMTLDTLHDKYRFILAYTTDKLKEDRYSRFLQEIIITSGLRDGNGKEDRFIPVFTNSYCGISEISIINGLQYFKFHSERQSTRNCYIESVRRLVRKGRREFR